jgi:hypothetical protein
MRWAAGADADRAGIEDDADRVLQAIEEHAAGVVVGPVVACDFSDGAIELDFTVESGSNSEVHQRVGLVASIVEREIPIVQELSSQTAADSAICA